ncbi:DUF2721 domain-containing protein [Sphingoaurantiacus capsulatus]|uniref:DUF2721 domain-containing protein n=1 Tax=Sphingoaurantiacus capsulatus TaxID=1771310 RepID=A0ABV7XCV9_9SPHN
MDESTVSDVAHVIQLAVAPVFLLAGIGSILNVMTARLGRVIDRARRLEAHLMELPEAERAKHIPELEILDRRMATAHWAIGCCVASALFVCLLVAILFLADMTERGSARVVAGLFTIAMGLIVVGLSLFLYEINIATRSVRVSRHLLPERKRRLH